MWFSAIKLAVSAGSKIYANRQKAKVAMSDAQLLHAERQARGEEAIPGQTFRSPSKRLQGRGGPCDINVANFGARLGGLVGRSGSYGENKNFLRAFPSTADLVYKFMDPCLREYFWHKGDSNLSEW